MSSWQVAGAILLPNLGGITSSLLVRNEIKTWYETLKRPSWRPPNYLFGPVWTALYCGMGYASYLVWRDGGGFLGPAKIPLALYGTQLALNWAWSPIFFGLHKLDWALGEISVLWVTVAASGYKFHEVNKTAGYLMVPYLAWLTLATALNYVIWRDNPKSIAEKE
ncbi:translocator protein isoform X2 [Diaphorina citri]|uniref:Translocator protein isoform X1 n=1 Tax=Diaphorina citri TaxID=121845 RepID=A0A1S4EFU9_DIACI|nr:translocator protein isoform X1 [Diaphorina citri]XP_026681784.1 translocator protein isoform X2 [Diaphorina citri]KAI5756027.1 hypothetical protein M8J77_021483 [Diaphorina citri]